jgi:phage gp29-like protein
MGALFTAADNGEIGPLNELIQEIWGKDPFVGGPIGDRLTAASAVDLVVEHNPLDPDQYRAVELAAFVERILPQLQLFKHETREKGERVPVKVGGLSQVFEALSIPWLFGEGIYWPIWSPRPGERRPVTRGIELLDPRRYRLDATGEGQLFLEDAEFPMGRPLWSIDPFKVFALQSSRAGMPLQLSGVGRGLIFWWWLRINGSFDLARYLEKFALPNIIGETSDPTGGGFTDDERAELDEFLRNYMNDVTALFPKGFKAILLTAPAGGHLVFEAIERVTKSAILYGIFGNETLTSSSGSAAGAGIAGGAASTGERVHKELVLGDRRRVAEGLEHIGAMNVAVQYGPEHSLYPPRVFLIDQSPRPVEQGNEASPSSSPTGARPTPTANPNPTQGG